MCAPTTLRHRLRQLPRPQHLRDAPRLGDTATRREWRIAIENLADAAQPRILKVLSERQQKTARPRFVAMHP